MHSFWQYFSKAYVKSEMAISSHNPAQFYVIKFILSVSNILNELDTIT